MMGAGEQRTMGLMRGGYAGNLVGPATVPSPRDLDERVHDLWTTPHGVIKAALANQPTLATRSQDGRTLRAVSFEICVRMLASSAERRRIDGCRGPSTARWLERAAARWL